MHLHNNLKKTTIAASFFIFAMYAVLIVSLFYFLKPDLLSGKIFSERIIFSIKLSLGAATIASILSVLIGIPAAFALSRYDFTGKTIIDSFLELPMIVSPAALGAMLLIFFNNPAGIWVQENVSQFVFTVNGIILAQFITTAGVATRLIKAAMDEIPARYENVARSLGASPYKAFMTVTLPLAKKGIIASVILTWAKALGEFGASITISGSMAMKTETLPISIYMRLANADIEGTVILILLLVSIGLFILFGVRLITKSGNINA